MGRVSAKADIGTPDFQHSASQLQPSTLLIVKVWRATMATLSARRMASKCEQSLDEKLKRSYCAGALFEWTRLNVTGNQQAAWERAMKRIPFRVIASVAVSLAVLGGVALAAQNRHTLKVPNGLAFSEFKGYETWQNVAVSQTETSLKVIAANDVMINAYRKGVPGNGKTFLEGSKIVKIEWSSKKNAESPYFVMVPDNLKSISFIEKDTKRFPDTKGWAFAQFLNDAASDTLTPNGNDAKCGYACHTTVAAKDYIFTAYPKR